MHGAKEGTFLEMSAALSREIRRYQPVKVILFRRLCVLLCNYERIFFMKAHWVQIGNSRGTRLPKLLIEQAGLSDKVELQVQDGAIIISRADKTRTGWAEAAARLSENGENALMAMHSVKIFRSATKRPRSS